MTRSTTRESTYVDLDYCNLEQCISNLTEAFNRVPESCRETARFYCDYGEEYGSSYARQMIQYERPETDDEMNRRIETSKRYEAQRIEAAKKLLGIK